MSEEPAAVKLSGKLIIGLTGNIATGKTAVMKLAVDRGALTIDADNVVHELMDNDAEMQAAIAVAFGSDVRREDGRIDRRALGEIVFNDPAALRDLEAMTHPAVGSEIARRILESEANIVLIEAIKLLEGQLASACHQIWVTRCSRQTQLNRLRVCRGLDKETAVSRIQAQSSQEEKVARADVVIDTNGLMRDTEKQFDFYWNRLPDPASAPPKELGALPPKPVEKAARPPGRAAAKPVVTPPTESPPRPAEQPEGLDVRRARPSDVASMLLLIQKATGGVVKMKRAELLMALSERGYFIGQVGTEISALVGLSIDSQVARIDQIFIHPLTAVKTTGLAILDEVEKSANAHICEIILAFLPADAPAELEQLFDWHGYGAANKADLPQSWQQAITESQPENTHFLIKVLRDRRLQQ